MRDAATAACDRGWLHILLNYREDSCFIDRFQPLGNDIPSERLHLRRVQLRTAKDVCRQNAARKPERRSRSEVFAVDSRGADRFAVRNSRAAADGNRFRWLAAVLTALKTGENLIWACVALLIVAGAIRAFDLQRYQARKSNLNEDEAARWKPRYQIGAMV